VPRLVPAPHHPDSNYLGRPMIGHAYRQILEAIACRDAVWVALPRERCRLVASSCTGAHAARERHSGDGPDRKSTSLPVNNSSWPRTTNVQGWARGRLALTPGITLVVSRSGSRTPGINRFARHRGERADTGLAEALCRRSAGYVGSTSPRGQRRPWAAGNAGQSHAARMSEQRVSSMVSSTPAAR